MTVTASWLVRSNQRSRESGTFVISGPFDTETLKAKIRAGQWRGDDELCPANGFWFFFHESGAMQEHLGIPAIPLLRAADEEPTQPDIVEVTDKIAKIESLAAENTGGSPVPTVVLPKTQSYRVEPKQVWGVFLVLGMALAVLGVVLLLRSLHASSV